MNRDVVLQKVESLERCLRRVEQKTPPTLEQLQADLDAQDIVILNLERAVQLSVDLAMMILAEKSAPVPATMAEAFEQLAAERVIDPELASSMSKAVGFRNIAVQAYRRIDWAVVWSITQDRLEVFRIFASAIVTNA